MRRVLLTALALLWCLVGPTSAPLAPTPLRAQIPTFADEFTGSAGSAPNPANWTFDTGTNGFGNNELQTYTTSRTNSFLDGQGNLVIRAIKTGANSYTSARLKTQGLFNAQYGHVEMRAKIPTGQGIWPAFWAIGSNFPSTPWPEAGELDIMENIGSQPSTVTSALHGPGYSGGSADIVGRTLPNGARYTDGFHVFAMDWAVDSVAFSVDGTVYHTATPMTVAGDWVFNHSFYLLLNVAVGGNYPGNPDGTTVFPQEMVVDYIRITSAGPAPTPLPMGVPDFCYGSSDNVAAGATLNLSGTVTKGCLGIHGTVNVATNTALTVGDILVYPDGTLNIGTATTPATGVTVTFTNTAPTEAEQWDTGMVVFGNINVYGTPKTAFGRTTAAIADNATSITLAAAPVGWAHDDRLVIPGSDQGLPATTPVVFHDEVTVLDSVSTATLTVAAVTEPHPAAVDNASVVRFTPHVGNLTRSIIFKSANGAGNRAHIAFVGNAKVNINYAAFKDLGRTTIQPLVPGSNTKGRYPFHFHMMGDASVCRAIGNVVEDSPKWGIALHQTNGCTVTDNVIYLADGAGMMTEDGNEAGNFIARNLIVRVDGSQEGPNDRRGNQDFGHEGSCLWSRGPANRWVDNVGADCYFAGMMYSTVYAPVTLGGTTPTNGTNPNRVPILEMSGNEVYAVRDGLQIYNLGAECCATIYDIGLSVFADMKIWHVYDHGVYCYGNNNVTLRRMIIINAAAALSNSAEGPVGFWCSDYLTRKMVLDTPDFQNLRVGVYTPMKAGDLEGLDPFGSTPGELTVTGGTLNATYSIHRDVMTGISGGGVNLPPRIASFSGVTLSAVSGNPGGTHKHLKNNFGAPFGAMNMMQLDRLYINGDQLFWAQQAGSYTPPALASPAVGSPNAAFTNTQLRAQYGVSMGGEIATCETVVALYDGFKCSANSPPPDNPPADTQAPAITIVNPKTTDTMYVGGVISVQATATDNVGIVFGTLKIGIGSAVQKLYPIDTLYTTDTEGALTVTFTATDAAGNTDTESVTVTILPVVVPEEPPTTPTGYTFCAVENEQCLFNGTKLVIYGVNTSFTAPVEKTNGTPCNNATFGDPALGITKACYYKDAVVTPPTPVNCVVSGWTLGTWSAWVPINATTEQRTRTNTRVVLIPESNGGTPCPGLTQIETETRAIIVVPPADADGDGVPDSSDACPTVYGTLPNGCPAPTPPPPPVDCVVSAWTLGTWSAWAPISATVEERTRTNTRTVITAQANGGLACPNLTQTETEQRTIVVTPPPPPPPPPPPGTLPAPSLSSSTIATCTIRLVAISPAGTGWKLQFREGTSSRGAQVVGPNYTQAFSITAGTHVIVARWTKSRATTQTSNPVTVVCP